MSDESHDALVRFEPGNLIVPGHEVNTSFDALFVISAEAEHPNLFHFTMRSSRLYDSGSYMAHMTSYNLAWRCERNGSVSSISDEKGRDLACLVK